MAQNGGLMAMGIHEYLVKIIILCNILIMVISHYSPFYKNNFRNIHQIG